jgi:hypothetical protein
VRQDQDRNGAASEPKNEGAWYTHPDWWVAIGTGGLVFVTGGRWIFTALLWASTRRAVIDGEKALVVAQSNAKAARDSADALPALERAYLFIELHPNSDNAVRSFLSIIRNADTGDRTPKNQVAAALFSAVQHEIDAQTQRPRRQLIG